MLGGVFERFVEESPISVMVRGLMEKTFSTEVLERIFEANAKVQYTKELLFSDVVQLMSLVVCGIHPSVNAAYIAKAKEIQVSRTAVYDKINGIEPAVSAAVLRETAASMTSIIEVMGENSQNCYPVIELELSTGTVWRVTKNLERMVMPKSVPYLRRYCAQSKPVNSG